MRLKTERAKMPQSGRLPRAAAHRLGVAAESGRPPAAAILLGGGWQELELGHWKGQRRAGAGKPRGRILKVTSIKGGKLPEATVTYHHHFETRDTGPSEGLQSV